MRLKRISFRLGLFLLTLGLLIWGFQEMLWVRAPGVFSDPKEDMSFAWYVPLFSLYVAWTERSRLRAAVSSPSWGGVWASLPFLAIGFLGVRGIQVRFEILAVAGLLVTLPWAFFGRQVALRLLFPAGFLLFCIPLASFLDVVTVHLRLLASATAEAVLQGVGAEVIRRGTMLAAADGTFSIDVAQPCSGLRSIFALMALSAAYAYYNQPTWLRRAALFALSVPLAVLGNVMRILSICLVGSLASSSFATGFYHDYSGYVVFAVAILLLVACGELLTRICGPAKVPEETESVAAPCSNKAVPAWATLFLVAAVMGLQVFLPTGVLTEAPPLRLGELAGYASETLEASEAERTILPSDTRIEKRRYRDDRGHWYLVSLVVGGRTKSSIHRPELCLPAQGFQMLSPHSATVAGVDWRLLTVTGPSDGRWGFAYTFANQAGFRTASHMRRIMTDVWDRSVLGRIDRWAMLTVHASTDDDLRLKDFLARLKEVLP